MDLETLPVIRLTEKSLRRLKDKVEKLQLDKSTYDDNKSSRTPKFEVYKPGVTRLSNRLPPSNGTTINSFSKSDLSRNSFESQNNDGKTDDSHRKYKENKDSFYKESPQNSKPISKMMHSRQRREKGSTKWSATEQISKKTSVFEQSGSSDDSYDDEEEGFLARHERRRKRQGYLSYSSNDPSDHETNQKSGSEHDYIWDDYHGEFLNDEFSVSTTSDDILAPPLNDNKMPTSAAETVSNTGDAIDTKETAKHSDRGILRKISENISEPAVNDTRKQLFNPDNPEIPIMVRANLRDKKINKSKSAASNRRKEESRKTRDQSQSTNISRPASENCYSTAQHVDTKSLSSVLNKYTSHPNHWNAPVGIDLAELDQEKSTDEHDVLSSGISDRGSGHSYETLLKEAERLEIIINNLLSPRQFSLKTFNEKLQFVRTELKQIYKSLILHHIEVSSKQNVEQTLWKTVYHQVMELLRKQIALSSGEEKNDLKNLLIVVLDQATEFYENLLMRLQRMYKIDLKELFSNVSAFKQFQKRIGKRKKLAIMSCQRSLICLGDISRYKENANESTNFGRARQYYMQARTLEPRNGRPYNQLALLAVHTRRKLDAVYYYARSLATLGNPILTARESLIALFDDARRKYQRFIDGKSKEKEDLQNSSLSTDDSSKKRSLINSPRIIWHPPSQDENEDDETAVKPDVSMTDEKSGNEQDRISSMSPSQLLRHFLLVFTHVHGKLFTRVGLDTVERLTDEMLSLFDKVLSEDVILISKQTLLHIFAVDFFTVFDQNQRQNSDPSNSSWLFLKSTQITLSMIAILTRHVTTYLDHLPTNQDQVYDPSVSKELSLLLPSLKVCYDWMYSNKSLWYPDAPPRPNNTYYDVWSGLAQLCDWLIGDYRKFPIRIYNQNLYNREEVCLTEDSEFAGFAPLANFDCESRYVLIAEYTSNDQKIRAAECVRLDLIRDFLEYLCGIEHPLLAFKQGRYVVLIENTNTTEEVQRRLSSTDDTVADAMEEKLYVGDDEDKDDVELRNFDEDFSELRALRDSLQRRKYDHDKRKDHIMASLVEKNSETDSVHVKPQYLIPDTNCFIDYLDYIKALVICGKFTICIPLVVLVELQGLSQDGKSKTNKDHSRKVFNNASVAVDYLKKKFFERELKLQAITNQGSVLHTINFQSQSDSESKATNDDLILQCCIKYEEKIKGQSQKFIKTVLLTDDRNLRVKALARNMPTKPLFDFCKWAQVEKA